jgi:hypothetical protein
MTVLTTQEAGLSFAQSGEVFFESDQDDISTLLLALLCHSQAVAGSALSCETLTAAGATLLVSYRPAQVRSAVAERAAVEILESAGIEPLVDTTREDLCAEEGGDGPAIVELLHEAGSPVAFRDRLRMHLLSAVQKQGDLGDDWMMASLETCLGGGGGGT